MIIYILESTKDGDCVLQISFLKLSLVDLRLNTIKGKGLLNQVTQAFCLNYMRPDQYQKSLPKANFEQKEPWFMSIINIMAVFVLNIMAPLHRTHCNIWKGKKKQSNP